MLCSFQDYSSDSVIHIHVSGLPWSLSGKELPANAGEAGLIPGSGRSPGEGNGNPLQYSCLGNPMDKGAWWATVLEVPRIRHNSVTKQQQHTYNYSFSNSFHI